MDDDASWLLHFDHCWVWKPAARIQVLHLGSPIFHWNWRWMVRNWGIFIDSDISFSQWHSLPRSNRWWWQKALSELTLEVFFGLCVMGQVRETVTASGSDCRSGAVLGFRFPRGTIGEPMKLFKSWEYVSSIATNAGLGQEKTNLTNYRRLKFFSIHLYSLSGLPAVNPLWPCGKHHSLGWLRKDDNSANHIIYCFLDKHSTVA